MIEETAKALSEFRKVLTEAETTRAAVGALIRAAGKSEALAAAMQAPLTSQIEALESAMKAAQEQLAAVVASVTRPAPAAPAKAAKAAA